jgi:hypothetical protein
MSWRVVTSFDNPVAAEMARNYLHDNGIEAILGDEELVATMWSMSNALGGIKLMVSAGDVALAEYLLARRPGTTASQQPEDAIAATPDAAHAAAGPGQAEPIVETPADKLALRAWRATVFGLMFPPLQLYALYVLMQLWVEPSRLSPEFRNKPKLALALSLPLWALVFIPFLWLSWALYDPNAPRWHMETLDVTAKHAMFIDFPWPVEPTMFRAATPLGEARVPSLQVLLGDQAYTAEVYQFVVPPDRITDEQLEEFLRDKLAGSGRRLLASKWIEHGKHTGIEYRTSIPDATGKKWFARGQLFRVDNGVANAWVESPNDNFEEPRAKRFFRSLRIP